MKVDKLTPVGDSCCGFLVNVWQAEVERWCCLRFWRDDGHEKRRVAAFGSCGHQERHGGRHDVLSVVVQGALYDFLW